MSDSETSTLVEWDPQDQDEKLLKETINQLFVVPTESVITQVPVITDDFKVTEQKKPQFILKTRGYYDVKTYVYAGMLFPKTTKEFADLYNMDAMKKLTDLDEDIWTETCNTMVGIQNSCEDFNKKSVANWLLVTNQTIQYCQYAIELLTGFGDSSLKAQLSTLLDKKYSTEASQNDVAFQDAAQAANAILLELSTAAKDKAIEVDKLIKEIQAFLGETIANEERIRFLRQQYHDGPVTIGKTKTPKTGMDGQPQKPYAFWLQSELETLRANITKAYKQYNDDFDEWKHNTVVACTAVTYIWIPVVGFIAGSTVMGIHAHKARLAHEAYEQHKAEAEKLASEEAPLVKLLEDIRMLTSQHEDMATKMHSAIAALNEIKALFLAQSQNYGLAASMMGLAQGKIKASLFLRKTFLQQSVDKAVKNWQEVSNLAKEFLATADVQTVGITPDVKPPTA